MPLAGAHQEPGLDIVDRDMADPFSAAPLRAPRVRAEQFRFLLQALLDLKSTADDNPLCLVTAGGKAAILRDVADWAAACGRSVFVRDGEALGEEIDRSLADNSWNRLRNRVAGHDLVIVERVEAIGDRQRLTAFRHLFDAAVAGGTRFCLSLAANPTSGHLPADLAGRLAGGHVLPLTPDEQARHVQRSPAQDQESAAVRQPSLPRVFAATARHYGISSETLLGPCRSRTISQARSLAMYLARHLTKKSFSAIGRACGDRDHTTALHGLRITTARIASDPALAADAAAILQSLAPRDQSKGRVRRRPHSLSIPCR